MDRSALITGGTGGLGTAVVEAFLADGWRAVVPWIERKELERLPARAGLTLIEGDLFESDSVADVVGAAAGEEAAPLRAVVTLVGGFAAGPRVHETPIDDFEK
jgi:NAD(P)-dependent dehydrogenase (short-subunit alcohol dehydrogenase family)